MADDQRRQSEALERRRQQLPHLAPRVHVERSQRLVEQERARLHRERSRERDTLFFAAGERGWTAIRQHTYTKLLQYAARTAVAQTRAAHGECHILAHRRVIETSSA